MTIRRALAVLTMAFAVSAPAWSLEVDNRSGKAIASISATPKGGGGAPIELLTAGAVASGERGEIALSQGEEACVYDLKIAFGDGTGAERPDMDVCQTETLIVE